MTLFEPLDINGMVIPNRIMVPAMVTRLAGEDGFVNQAITDRYVRYAEGEVGLIVIEAMAVHHAKAGPLLRISDNEYIPGLADVVRRIHGASASKVVPQIIHFMKASRSGWRQTIDTLSLKDIDLIVEQFGDAVARAREAGFDGAELHSAHAYTLSSFLSRANRRRDEYGGDTIEGRLRLIGRVMENIRRKVGADFPVCIRIVSDEYIKDGYTIDDSKLIALRLAQLGFDYISLSVGGKFEDAIHKPGEVLYPYTGYSGDRCMPGDWFPAMLHTHLAREIRSFVRSKGYRVPIAVAGKISEPADAQSVIADGSADIVAMARALLADPYWPRKVRTGDSDRVIRCDYCNVCKQLDATHHDVICYLWPKGAKQAPKDEPGASVPKWGEDRGGLSVGLKDGEALLRWSKPEGAVVHYDVYRTDDDGEVRIIDGVKTTRCTDSSILGGVRYRYYVRACDATGGSSAPSSSVVVEPLLPRRHDAGNVDATTAA
jgi:2,4-dienoyl-CoA reductase-like NADH-dependent reductase (Old Yellow Enzyme family)